ncbi:T9SS type B sorting domain-containing protein [Aquimarina hainanensis]|uniref:T9SS type B sorting domain-containing protein n=1 Tax=Aquimarina hainanensis TaxID=1578017 RepID=A0ABW5NAT1_9FLAO|nr:T9SS type B sorting domain-containing protein [Aquimarina sp. TRL1]QKX03532.1 T9SS type B sorting domain-containing protein [Aquimarina sp. TRL1]
MNKLLPQISLYLLIAFMSCLHTSYGQDGLPCTLSTPFCSDQAQELTFDNTVGVESLGEIGCLNTTPNPAWFFLRVDQGGTLEFDIVQWVDENDNSRLDRNERQLDVDFIAWGPFTTSFVNCDVLATGCDNNGDGDGRPAECVNNVDEPFYYLDNEDNTNIVDCSYSRTEAVEKLTILNAQPREYYIILITNFANESGKIQLQQTNLGEENSGTTDCTILEPGLGPDIATCGVVPVMLEGFFEGAVSYQWFVFHEPTDSFQPVPGATIPVYEAPGPGTYRLEARDGSGAVVGTDDINVNDVTNALISVGYSIAEESFAGSYTITAEPQVTVGEISDYEFSINGGEYQSSPVFTNVPPGDHVITGRHIQGCSERDSETIIILGYPKYFTPNGDGFHDTWHLINIEDQTTALIYIFDRHGKLLKQLRPNGAGWDGTYNGSLMPSSDYWFRVEFNEPRDPNNRRRVFKSSFSLIR